MSALLLSRCAAPHRNWWGSLDPRPFHGTSEDSSTPSGGASSESVAPPKGSEPLPRCDHRNSC